MIKLLLHILFLTWFSFSLNAQDSCRVSVNIEVNDDSASIFLDGLQLGKGKASTNTKIGEHEVVVMRSLKEWGSDIFTDSIKISDCDSTVNLKYNFKHKTIVTSSPDAAVFHNDSLLGYTPLKVPLKYRNLSLEKINYTSKNILLENTSVQQRINLDYIGNENEKPFIESTTFKVLVGSAIALGATAAYLKLEADKKFDQYLETRNNKYLDDTDQLDLYSGLALGALQINIGALLYFFLFD